MVANCIESFYLKAPCFVSLLFSKHQLTIMIFRDLLLFFALYFTNEFIGLVHFIYKRYGRSPQGVGYLH